MGNLKIDKYLVFALFFALLNVGAIFFIFGFQQYSDSQDYFQTIHWLRGESPYVDAERALRPLGPILAAPFEFFGEGAGLIVQNLLFYLASAFLIFRIVELLFRNKKQAVLAVMLWVTATPMLEYGLSYLTDTGAWFFYLLSIFLTLLYFYARKYSFARNAKPTAYPKLAQEHSLALPGESIFICVALISSMGVLMKENGSLGIVFFGMMLLLSREFSWTEKILKIIKVGLIFLAPLILFQLAAYKFFQYTSLDWYLDNSSGAPGESILLVGLRYLGQLFRILGIIWPLVLWGLFLEWREKNWDRLKIYLALLPPSFSFLLWTVGGGGRTVFIFAPLGIILASYALKKRGPLFLSALFFTIAVLNYWFVSVNQQMPFTDLLYTLLFSKGQ